jgi:enamine deaminase RidA (YjgF/YER057c/UK114 family)
MDSIVPEDMQWHYDEWHLSPLVVHDGLGFISGVTATRPDGSCAEDVTTEITEAFDKLGHVLEAGGMSYGDIIEMTTFHIGMRSHLDVFRTVKDRYLVEPWPAWSAIGTTELATPGPRVELRVICQRPSQ